MPPEIVSIKKPVPKSDQQESPVLAGAIREAKFEKVKRQEREQFIADSLIFYLESLQQAPEICWTPEAVELLEDLSSKLPKIAKKVQQYQSMSSQKKIG